LEKTFGKNLDKTFLEYIFGIPHGTGITVTDTEHSSGIQVIQLLLRLHFAFEAFPNQFTLVYHTGDSLTRENVISLLGVKLKRPGVNRE